MVRVGRRLSGVEEKAFAVCSLPSELRVYMPGEHVVGYEYEGPRHKLCNTGGYNIPGTHVAHSV